MGTAVVLFTRDLRVNDHPALAAAARSAERIVPLFVLDDAILASEFARPNRLAFLAESLEDLDGALAERGGRLVVRRGAVVGEVVRMCERTGASAVHMSRDVSGYATTRERALLRALAGARRELVLHPGITVVEAGALTPADGDHYRVFTPYWNAWRQTTWRAPVRLPERLRLPEGLSGGDVPPAEQLAGPETSPDRPVGGLREGRRRVERLLEHGPARYESERDDLASEGTSGLSPYLHFGCVSPLGVAERVGRRGGEALVRQLCWRDFHHQVLAAVPSLPRVDYRDRGDRWRTDPEQLEAWRQGRTGVPIVDAGMRQLAREGWMHNRTRLLVASFLTKDLGIDWRAGAQHFLDLLVDGDLANNSGNWQWVAGTGNDTRPNRIFNPVRQAHRYDPAGEYVRRYVPELGDLASAEVHAPWELEPARRRRLDYPPPLVDHDEAVEAFRRRRGAAAR